VKNTSNNIKPKEFERNAVLIKRRVREKLTMKRPEEEEKPSMPAATPRGNFEGVTKEEEDDNDGPDA